MVLRLHSEDGSRDWRNVACDVSGGKACSNTERAFLLAPWIAQVGRESGTAAKYRPPTSRQKARTSPARYRGIVVDRKVPCRRDKKSKSDPEHLRLLYRFAAGRPGIGLVYR